VTIGVICGCEFPRALQMNETVVTTMMITGFGVAFFHAARHWADRFQIHHTTLACETPDHECSLVPEERSD